MGNIYYDETDAQVVTTPRLKQPDRYRVILHNDDYTTMEFVVAILCKVFRKSQEEATEIMLRVHTSGRGECGVYTYEIAESKVHQVVSLARQAGFPLACTMEKE